MEPEKLQTIAANLVADLSLNELTQLIINIEKLTK